MPRVRKKRTLNIFTLSFLDVMAGGFGAVILLFLIMPHSLVETEQVSTEQLAQARLLDWEFDEGQKNLAEKQREVGDLRNRIADAINKLETLQDDVTETTDEVKEVEKVALDQSKTIETLKSEIEASETEIERRESIEEQRGASPIEITGDGDRQYLTGLFIGGNHILIAVDGSASMLAETVWKIVRIRSMSTKAKQIEASAKWRRTVKIVEWLIANIPVDSNFQVAFYNEDVKFLVGDGDWHPVLDRDAITDVMDELKTTAPSRGTNMEKLFIAFGQMDPIPDNIFLITDGLPTLDESRQSRRRINVTPDQRYQMFTDLQRELVPAGVPINTILLPLEGDPWASGKYWELAYQTGGTFMTPSEDWP